MLEYLLLQSKTPRHLRNNGLVRSFTTGRYCPVWTIGTIITIMITRSEDKGGLLGKVANVAQGKLKHNF